MFDHIFFCDYSKHLIERLEQNEALEFTGEHSMSTGLVNESRSRTKFDKYFIKKRKDKFGEVHMAIGGSLHKVVNGHNASDFTWQQFTDELIRIEDFFTLDGITTRVVGLEFGVNIELPLSPKAFIKNILSYKGKTSEVRKFNGNGYLLVFQLDDYIVKIYDKGMQLPQYTQGKHILRIELRSRKSRVFNKYGIFTFKDLYKIENAFRLQKALLTAIKQLVILDNTILNNAALKPSELFFLQQYRDREMWENTVDYKQIKRKFSALHKKYNAFNWNKELTTLVSQKFSELFPYIKS